MAKERLDKLLVQQGYFPTRSKAQAVILAGNVLLDERVVDKPGMQFREEELAGIRIRDKNPYVSRGALKLEPVLDQFGVNCSDKVVLDVGASTGGFTDLVLQRGARLVYAVDVGFNQLDYRLRQSPRVISLEKTNARNLARSMFEQSIDLCVIDVSFISLTLILPSVFSVMDNISVIALIKPQFEQEKPPPDFNGIVTDPKIHLQCIERVVKFTEEAGYQVKNLTYSTVPGPKGNIEFFIWITDKMPPQKDDKLIQHQQIVSKAHKNLKKPA